MKDHSTERLLIESKKEARQTEMLKNIDTTKNNLRLEVIPRSRSRLRQFGGMMDPGKLIEEKKHIMDRKITNRTRAELFPLGHIEYKQAKKIHYEDIMKVKASPAHSHRFMENMLLQALKKAGYD